jgi:hypothetical protein
MTMSSVFAVWLRKGRFPWSPSTRREQYTLTCIERDFHIDMPVDRTLQAKQVYTVSKQSVCVYVCVIDLEIDKIA